MNQHNGLRIRKFNPGTFQSDHEVVNQFVIRHYELETVLNILRGNIDSPSCQHSLIVAPRGRGKTMLLARTAAELRINDEFSNLLLPVQFMEESQEVFNMADFWLETLLHLSRECERTSRVLARELRERHTILGKQWRDPLLEDRAQVAVLEAADWLNRRLVLMIENLQSLFENVEKGFGWKLRKVLQNEPQIVVVGSATVYFEGLSDARQPFFEFFRRIDLHPLKTEECRDLWAVVSGDNVGTSEMRPIEILTGGSPRLLVIVAGFARHRSMRRLMEELVLLVDEHTEYFRGQLEALGKTERRVYLAVLDLWQYSTPSEISIRARMDIRVVSTMLGRLVKRGAIVVDGSGRKRSYAAAERLFCIYYKLRRNRDKASVVYSLLRFMAAFYNKSEQAEVFTAMLREAADSREIRVGLERAAAENPAIAEVCGAMNSPDIAYRRNDTIAIEEQRLMEELMRAYRKGEYENVVSMVDQLIMSQNPDRQSVGEWGMLQALVAKAIAQHCLGRLEAAVSTNEDIVERFGSADSPELQVLVAQALTNKGRVLEAQGKMDLALSAYDEVVKRIGAVRIPYRDEVLAQALTRKGIVLHSQGQVESAVATYKEIVELFDTAESPELQGFVAQALMWNAEVLSAKDKLEPALEFVDEIIERFGSTAIPRAMGVVAFAHMYRGRAARNAEEFASAVMNCDKGFKIIDALERTEETNMVTENLQRLRGELLFIKAHALNNQGKRELAVASLDEVVKRFCSSESAEFQQIHITALGLKTELQAEAGRFEEALDTFRLLYAKYEPDNERMTREVATILIKLTSNGVGTGALLEVITSNEASRDALFPFVVALRQEAGEEVRAPYEVLEVASDVRKEINKLRLSETPEPMATDHLSN